MIKVAFFLNNEQLEGLDWSNVIVGNPGAGGTEYEFVLEAYLMSMESGFDVVLYVLKNSIFPESLHVKNVPSLKDAIIDANSSETDYLVIKENQKDLDFLNDIPKRTGLILWAHNFLSKKAIDVYADNSVVKSIICVGREMLDLYRDEKAFKKMDYIYNGCVFGDFEQLSAQLVDVNFRSNIVTYIGSIIEAKSFHWLAKAWPNVLKAIPDAELYIIGSGNLYDKNAKLGKYGIASEQYERLFMPYLTDRSGQIIPSVHFMGKMGDEKNEIIKKTKVGVPNPSGASETFGITAVEMQSLGCHVVTMKCPGYLDTVMNTRYLYSYPFQLSKYIIDGLTNPTSNFKETFFSLKKKFDYKVTHQEWVKLFYSLTYNNCAQIHDLKHTIPNIFFNHKWLRIINEKVNRLLVYKMPSELAWKSNCFYRKYKWIKSNIMEWLVY